MSRIKDINLVPHDVIMRDVTQERMRTWAVIVLLVIVFLMGAFVLEKRELQAVEGVVSDLSMKKSEMEEKVKQLNILQDKRDRLAKKERVINTLLQKRSLSLLFSELEKSMNNNVRLTSFDFKDGLSLKSNRGKDSDKWVETGYFIVKKDNSAIQNRDAGDESPGVTALLQGIANSNNDLAGFLEQLSASALFSDVDLKYSREAIDGELKVVEFQIETTLENI